jgi:hypothetical protein
MAPNSLHVSLHSSTMLCIALHNDPCLTNKELTLTGVGNSPQIPQLGCDSLRSEPGLPSSRARILTMTLGSEL